MPGQLQVKIIGLQKVEAALSHLPAGVRPFYERAAKFAQGQMKKHAKPRHAGQAKLAEVIDYEIKGEAGTPYALSAHIGFVGKGHGMRSSLGAIAPTVNYGRRPGKQPSISAIHRWLAACGYHVSPRTAQQEIGERGTKGKFFMERTVEDLAAELPKLTRETEAEIRAQWDRG